MSTALLARSAAHDRAFERLYKRHVHEVYRYVLAVLRNQADAEDVTQATFLSAYRAVCRGEEPLKPRNWLLKIAHNECRQRFRALSRRPKEVELDERTAAPGLDETVPSAQEIRTALAHLGFNQRSALVMRELEGRSYHEIASILDLSTSAVETLLFRARRALREQLEGALTCGEAEAALLKRLDGRLSVPEQRSLRAHLRECRECALLERRQRARRAAVKRLGVVQLPPSLAGFLGGTGSVTGGAVVGSGLVAKAAAVVAAGVVAGGVGHEAVQSIAADQPARTPLPELKHPRQLRPAFLSTDPLARAGAAQRPETDSASSRGRAAHRVRKSRDGAPSSDAAKPGTPPGAPAEPVGGVPLQPPAVPGPIQGVVDQTGELVKPLPAQPNPVPVNTGEPPLPVEVPTVTVPQLPPPPPLPPPPLLPPPPPLLPPPPPPLP